MEEPIIKLLYGTRSGRLLIKAALKAGLPKIMAGYLRSPLSKRMIPRYIKKHEISLADYPKAEYHSFSEFFSRKKRCCRIDDEDSHFISPCDGWLSVYPVHKDSSFSIKGSHYRLCDLVNDEKLAWEFCDGLCMIFRLTASDYHHYAFIDDGYIHKSHFIEGKLHSVQPIACDAFPVYRLNRRLWSLLNTDHFGPVIQVEVGAMAVGGIVNEREDADFIKGEEMGHFELCGSTIVLFVQKDRIELLPEICTALSIDEEFRVSQGMWIATSCDSQPHKSGYYKYVY